MAALAVQEAKDGNGFVTFAAAAGGGDTVVGGVDAGGWALPAVLLVDNQDVADADVTVGDLGPVTVTAGELGVIPVRGGGVAGAVVSVSYTSVTSMTVAAVRLW